MQWPDETANALIQIHLSHRPSVVPAFIPFITFIPVENLWNWDGGVKGIRTKPMRPGFWSSPWPVR